MAEVLNVEKREQTGSLRMKRMRQAGNIPAMLYGHGEDGVMLKVNERELNKVINLGSYIVDLKGAANESALIKDVQWDAFGIKVLHLDLTRVDANEAVEVTLPIELKGDPIGTRQGGTLNFHQHEITILCPANLLPDKIELKVGELGVDQAINAGEIPLPEGATIAEDPNTPVVSCSVVVEKTDTADDAAPGADEPEVIGGKKDEEE